MITDGKKYHYLSVKSLSVLLRGITSKHAGDFCCLNCFHSCSTKKHKKHYNVCKNHDYCYVEMPEEDNKIRKYNNQSTKHQFIYADFKCLLKEMSEQLPK